MPNEQKPSVDADALSRATEQLIENTPVNPAPQEAPKTPDPAPVATVPVDDVDEIEYRAAQDALKAEQNPVPPPAAKPAEKEPPKVEEPPAEKPADEPAADDKSNVVMIPKARFDEVLRQRDEAANRAAYLQGITDTQKEMRAQNTTAPVTPGKPAEPVKTIAAVLAEIDQSKLALAKRYDDGEITYSDLMGEQVKLDQQAHTIRQESLRIDAERIKSEAIAEARREGMGERLEDHAARMDEAHPSLLSLPQDPNAPEWMFLREKAVQELTGEGIVLKENDSRAMMQFRERIASLADKYFPMAAPAQQPAPGASPQAPAQAAAGKPSLAAQRRQKIELSHQQPPNTGQLGSSGTKPELSDTQIANMTDDEIAALPDATRARVKGIAA